MIRSEVGIEVLPSYFRELDCYESATIEEFNSHSAK